MNLPPRQLACRALLCLLFAGSLPGLAEAAPPVVPGATTRAALAARIDAHIAQPRFAAASWGVAVVSLDSGRTLYAHRADRLLVPASTAKLFTAGLSLSVLGADYRMPTRLLANGHMPNGRLDGPLVLYGMGDPTLGTRTSTDWAEQLASQASAHGLRFVDGDLIADDSYFTGPTHGSGWEAGDLQSWFAAPSSALSVQENTVGITLTPASTVGQPARLAFTPAGSAPVLAGQLLTSPPHSPDDINLYRAPGSDTLQVFGNIAIGTPARHYRLAVTDPARLAGEQLMRALKNRGIHVTGQVRVIHWPQGSAGAWPDARRLGEVLSPPLQDILEDGLKRSQNLYLQNLLRAVGARQLPVSDGFSSSETRGIKAMQQWLQQIGIPPSASLISEGAGLSRRNLVTPNALAALLVHMATQPYAEKFRDALPVAGVDGTLAGHMRHTAAENNVHAKTGSMAHTHCLAGYVTSAAGERLAFAIMLNNYEPPHDAPRASRELDAIAVMLADYRGQD